MGRRQAVGLHDAEDVVHSAELGLFDALIERFDLVQLPVLPLVDPGSRFIGGHYIDEFLEAHGKELVVRCAIGAALPSAGVGCAIRRDALAELAALRGAPFDPDSLTEDYELGLRLATLGRRSAFVRLPAAPGRPVVATREYFPATLEAAVAQKASWMTGIALAGWDRLGWSGGSPNADAAARPPTPLAALVLPRYLAPCSGPVGRGALLTVGQCRSSYTLSALIAANSALLLWRLALRSASSPAYGGREGVRALPRRSLATSRDDAARRAPPYRRAACRPRFVWDKTPQLPHQLPANEDRSATS